MQIEVPRDQGERSVSADGRKRRYPAGVNGRLRAVHAGYAVSQPFRTVHQRREADPAGILGRSELPGRVQIDQSAHGRGRPGQAVARIGRDRQAPVHPRRRAVRIDRIHELQPEGGRVRDVARLRGRFRGHVHRSRVQVGPHRRHNGRRCRRGPDRHRLCGSGRHQTGNAHRLEHACRPDLAGRNRNVFSRTSAARNPRDRADRRARHRRTDPAGQTARRGARAA